MRKVEYRPIFEVTKDTQYLALCGVSVASAWENIYCTLDVTVF